VLIDEMLDVPLAQMRSAAIAARDRGRSGAWVIEAKHDPFVALASCAPSVPGMSLGIAVAVAFARNPMSIAVAANDMQLLTEGQFYLGLGTQVKPHIERRFSMQWGRPVGRMREMIAAVRAIWSSWETGERLSFEGEFYQHTLMTSAFSPGPNPNGRPRIVLGALGPAMTELAGEVADGLVVHRFMTERYLREVTLPAVHRGLERSGRTMDQFEVCFPAFVVSGDSEATLEASRDSIRTQIAFYASTPSYRPVLDLHGWADLGAELHAMSRERDPRSMKDAIDDLVLNEFAVVTTPDKAAADLEARYGGLVDRILMYPAGA